MKFNFFKRENSLKKKDFSFNANLYWKLVLSCTIVIIIFSFFFGHYLFVKINQEPTIPVANDGGQVPTVKEDDIAKVLNYFSDKEKKSTDILNSPAPVVDPSL
jgi:hypothetical protein